MKALIVADEAASVLPTLLKSHGFDVAHAPDGAAAWRAMAKGTAEYCLLVADGTADGDGLELARRVRSSGALPAEAGRANYLYVLLLTRRDSREERQQAIAAGADDFLALPLDEAEVGARLDVAKRVLSLQADVRSRATRLEKLHGQLLQSGQMLGEILVEQGIVGPDQLQRALDQQSRTGKRLGALLLTNGWATEEDITRARAVQMEVPYADLSRETPDPALLERIPVEIARVHRMLPLSVGPGAGPLGGEAVRVAIVNPYNIEGLDAVQRLTGRRAEPQLVSEAGFQAAVERAYRVVQHRRDDAVLSESLVRTTEGTTGGKPLDGLDEDLDALALQDPTDEAPVIRLVNAVLTDAVRRRASDIHIEPYKTDFEIRYRIDGELQVIRTLPRQSLSSVTSRIKIMAEMDIAEKRVPQDGRIALKLDDRRVDLRVSSLPMQFGERIVLRVLDRASARLSLDRLDFSPRNRQTFEGLIHRPHGMLLVTGPTGSGKTTTLYAALNALRSPATNIMTCEDPIEYELDRIAQSAVNPKTGLTFAHQLRAILRQDPDIVLVGEIRDAETAETAFRAALTGHLVLSTLHCNEAAGAPTRLIEMGVPPFLIASALVGVVAQRLLRRLCPSCRAPAVASPAHRMLMRAMEANTETGDAPETLYHAAGCPECEGRGVRGRIGAHEVLTVTDEMQSLILTRGDTRGLRDAALRGGMVPMIGDGLEKVRRGFTTLEEVQRRLYVEAA